MTFSQSASSMKLCIIFRSSHAELFSGRGVLKICSKFTREHPCRSAISVKLQSNFIEIVLRHGCSPINLLHFFRAPFLKNTSGQLLQYFFVSLNEHAKREAEAYPEPCQTSKMELFTKIDNALQPLAQMSDRVLNTPLGYLKQIIHGIKLCAFCIAPIKTLNIIIAKIYLIPLM